MCMWDGTTMKHWCACLNSWVGVSPHDHTHFSRHGGTEQTGFCLSDTSHQARRSATLGTPKASSQGLIYQRDRSCCQGIPQKSAGLEMQRTKTLRCSDLIWFPGTPAGPCTLSPRGSTLAQAGQAQGVQRDALLQGGGNRKTEEGESGGGRTPTQKCPDERPA